MVCIAQNARISGAGFEVMPLLRMSGISIFAKCVTFREFLDCPVSGDLVRDHRSEKRLNAGGAAERLKKEDE